MSIIHKVHSSSQKGMEFILSDATPDRYGDIIDPNGWDLTHFKKNPIALFGHQSNFPIGTWENLRVKDGGLRGHLVMAPAGTSDRIDEIRKLIEADVLKAVSVGFRPIESKPISKSAPGEFYLKQELIETSVVSVPANPNALSVAKKLGISRRTMAMVFRNDGTEVTITEPSNYQRRKAVLANAKAILERLDKKIPGMLADNERRRRELFDEEPEIFEQESKWPQYNSWRGEKF